VSWLLDHGVALTSHDGDRQTALHWAAMGADLAMVELLIARGAPLEARNVYGGTVLDQALWSAAHGGDADDFVPVLEALIAAGAQVPKAHPPVNARVDAVLARHGSTADPTRHWYGEGP
jgi:ankyrin repeat protein